MAMNQWDMRLCLLHINAIMVMITCVNFHIHDADIVKPCRMSSDYAYTAECTAS